MSVLYYAWSNKVVKILKKLTHLLKPSNLIQVYQRLSDPEFISLKQDIAVCKGQAVECMAIRYFLDHGVSKMEVWVGSGASDWTDKKNNNEKSTHTSQLSRVDLSSSKPMVGIEPVQS